MRPQLLHERTNTPLVFLFNDKSAPGVRWHVHWPAYRRHITIRSGRLNAINGHDRRCNRIGVTPGQWGSAIRGGGCSCSIGFHEGTRGLMFWRPGVSHVFILPSIPVIPLRERLTLAFKISSSWKRYRAPRRAVPHRALANSPFELVTA